MCPNCTDMRYLFLSSLLALGLTASSQIPDYVPSDGLVAWFDFGNGHEYQTGNLVTLHGGAQLANGALDVSESGAWAESSELPSSFLNTIAYSDLHSRLKPSEMALLTVLIAGIEPNFNICMQSQDHAHSTKSIAQALGETPQSIRRKLKSLIEHGVLYHGRMKHYKAKPLGKVYVLNPHIAKVGRKKHAELAELFNPVNYSSTWQTDVAPSDIK